MSIHLYVSPAASGKTGYVVDLVLDASAGLRSLPRVVVPTHLQVRAWRRRLGESGGALGVRVQTFDRLCFDCLAAGGQVYTGLSEPVQYRLIRAVVDSLSLTHYGSLTRRPGFIRVLEELIGELKAAGIWPDDFLAAVAAWGGEPRLVEIGPLYRR